MTSKEKNALFKDMLPYVDTDGFFTAELVVKTETNINTYLDNPNYISDYRGMVSERFAYQNSTASLVKEYLDYMFHMYNTLSKYYNGYESNSDFWVPKLKTLEHNGYCVTAIVRFPFRLKNLSSNDVKHVYNLVNEIPKNFDECTYTYSDYVRDVILPRIYSEVYLTQTLSQETNCIKVSELYGLVNLLTFKTIIVGSKSDMEAILVKYPKHVKLVKCDVEKGL